MRRVMVCALWILLAGCTRGGAQPDTVGTAVATTSPSSASPTSTLSDAERVAAAQATTAYLSLQRAFGEASKSANYHSADIARYSGDPARQQLTRGLYDLARQGIVTVIRGPTPTFSPVATTVSLAMSPPEVSVRDCVDTRSVYFVHKANGQSAEPTGAPYQPHRRHPATAVVRRYAGRWLVVTLATDQGATC